MSITRIKLTNFTAFAALEQDFVSGINVLIGANGTGKTHLLKTLYAACAITVGEDRDKSFAQKLVGVFHPYEGRIGRLSRRKSMSVKTSIVVAEGAAKLSVSFSNHTQDPADATGTGQAAWKLEERTSAYIPVKEMLSHAPGFLATSLKRELSFEEVYTDIIKRAFLPKLSGAPDAARQRVLNALTKAIDGKVTSKGETFFLKNAQGELEFTLLAEGIRKLALVWLLIQNGTLLSGSVLFWDEPEANLNPLLMGELVQVILELQRLGVQVFLATHNHVLLKEFDLRKQKSDAIRYISLFRDKGDDVLARATDTYADIEPNPIGQALDGLYDREVQRSLGPAK